MSYSRKVHISSFGTFVHDFYLDYDTKGINYKFGKAVDIAANPTVEVYPLNNERSHLIRVELYL